MTPTKTQTPTKELSRDEILARLREMLADMFDLDPAKIQPESQLMADLDLDSIDAIDLVVKLQEMTGKRVEEAALRKVRTVSDVVDLVESTFGQA